MADFFGTSGDDNIAGTDDADVIDVSQGGSDTVSAAGGDDIIAFGNTLNNPAGFDTIEGGDGFDELKLSGFYQKLNFDDVTISGVERISVDLVQNSLLKLTGIAPAGHSITVDGSASTRGFTLDAQGAGRGSLELLGGSGGDTLIGSQTTGGALLGGDGNDTIYSDNDHADVNRTTPHVIDGGAGRDAIWAATMDVVTGGDGDDVIDYVYGLSPELIVDAGGGDDRVHFHDAAITVDSVLRGGTGTDILEFEAEMSLAIPEFSAASSGFEILDPGGLIFTRGSMDHILDLSGFTVSHGLSLYGGITDDTIVGTGHDDVINGRKGSDVLYGGDGDDSLTGVDVADRGEVDRLVGGLGKDQMSGLGADVYVYGSIEDSLPGRQRDVISGFHQSAGATGDLIDLSAIDADTGTDGDQAFHLGGDAFTGVAGELISVLERHDLLLEADVDGDGEADFGIQMNGFVTSVSEGDFVL